MSPTISEIMAAAKERAKLGVDSDPEHSLIWAAIAVMSHDNADTKAMVQVMIDNVAFIARVFRIVTVAAPPIGVAVGILVAVGVL